MANKKLQVWLPLVFAIVLILGMFLGYRMRENMPSAGRLFSLQRKNAVDEVLDLINKRYVDPVRSDTLADAAIEEILTQLDPHSVFIPERDLQQVNEDLAGRFQGIGIEFNILSDTIHVVNVLKGGPSDKAGLKIGDRIIKVGEEAVAKRNITTDGVRKLLRGQSGSRVFVTVMRGSSTLQFGITRDDIPLYSLDASYLIAPRTGYVRLNKFAETTYEEFMQAMQQLREKGIDNLVLDLRDNGGGILQEAVEIADEFLDGNKLIVYTEGSHTAKQEYRAKRDGIFEQGKVVVLVDEGSASASEVLAGALQDWDRATIVGRRSFGKGLVQEQYSLSDGSALRLTVARYYTPLGRSIQKPYDKGVEQYNDELLDRYHNGELVREDTLKVAQGKAFTTPGGKKVYGGGGITPDAFVAFDTSLLNSNIPLLFSRNTLPDFVYRYYVDNLASFAQYRSPEDFNARFQTGPELLAALERFAVKDSVSLGRLSAIDRQFLNDRIKVLLARQQWRNEGFYEVSNANDVAVKRALELVQR